MKFPIRLLHQFLHNKSAKKNIGKLSTTDKSTLSSAILAISFVPKPFIVDAQEDPEFQQVVSLLHAAKKKNEIPDSLSQIFIQTKASKIQEFKDLKVSIEQEIFKDKKIQIEYLLQSGDVEKIQIAEKTKQSCYSSHPELTLKIEVIDSIITFMKSSVFSLHPDILHDEKFIDYYAYIILHPEILSNDFELDDEWKAFPLKWLVNQMSPAQARLLFTYYKIGQDYSAVFTSRYDDEGRIQNILDQIEDHTLPEFSNRCLLLKEAIECYKKGYYGATISLIIPQIEGIIWDYSKIYNRKFNNVYRIEGDNWFLLTTNGKEIDNYTVGNLLKQSEFGMILDQELLSYFCDELYNERNPIFHGRDLSFPSKFNAAKKLCSFEYIIDQINDNLIGELLKTMDETIDPEKVQLFLAGEAPLESLLPRKV